MKNNYIYIHRGDLNIHFLNSFYKKKIISYILKNSFKIIFLSKILAEKNIINLAKEKIIIIPNALDKNDCNLANHLFKENIKIILTSNTKISELYKDGLQRDQFKPFIKIMEKHSVELELKIEDDYRKSNENQKQRYFYPLNQETNFKINKFFRTITKDKNHLSKIISVKGRDFKIEHFYEGVARFNFDDLCNRNLGAEDYLEIIKNCKFVTLDNIPQFNDINSNQQQRFITLIDVIYDKNIPLAVTADQNIDQFTSSRLLENPFKRTISRLYELTSVEKN